MARRESQGLQITLIVFVMLTIILAVTTIAFWNRSKTLAESNASFETQNAEALQAERTATDEAMQMKVWLGHTSDTQITAIEQQYKRDMSTYARSAAEVQRNYKDVPAVLFAALQQRNKQVSDLRQQQKESQDESQQTQQQLLQQRDEAKRIQAETEAELRKARDEFAQYRDRLNQEKEQQASEIQQVRGQLAELEATSTQQTDEFQRELRNKDSIISQRNGELAELTTESFDVPDGKIFTVNPRTGFAFINLGAADGLRRQVTFSIFGVDTNNLAREVKKGSLEVTRIAGDHMAEVRITNDTIEDPVLAGDLIYTPLWNSKSALHFGLAGTFDLNDDGQDDQQIVKQLIRINNGTIDAEEKDGEVVGEMTRHTRYLILGEEPTVGDSDDTNATARQEAWSQLNDQADQLGIQRMSVQKLLDFIGYDGEKRTLPLGQKARSDDFQPRPGRDTGSGSVFRQRRPKPRARSY